MSAYGLAHCRSYAQHGIPEQVAHYENDLLLSQLVIVALKKIDQSAASAKFAQDKHGVALVFVDKRVCVILDDVWVISKLALFTTEF